MTQLPVVHAQTMSATMTAMVIAPESFWVKRPTGSSAVGHEITAASGSKNRSEDAWFRDRFEHCG